MLLLNKLMATKVQLGLLSPSEGDKPNFSIRSSREKYAIIVCYANPSGPLAFLKERSPKKELG